MSALSALVILVRIRPRIVILTHSRHFLLAGYLKRMGIRVFYDCMDLNGLFSDAANSDREDERELVGVSHRVFCSSELIATHIGGLGQRAEIDIVSNALHPEAFTAFADRRPQVIVGTVGYIGAISSWFDFDAVLAILDSRADVVVKLWGPCDVEIPEHDRIHYMGIVSHGIVVEQMHSCSVLLLPFKVTDLIRAVDPVKVYEYIATGRPVITCDYPQLDHFGNFIDRYSTVGELVAQVERLLDSKTLEREQIEDFIHSNSWNERAKNMLARMG
ncbi:hypothetical protein [Pseudarthrobacter sp. N5]|uniref:hypothetical protein n=1 Tax=Pseudarthrobacter sp. N5 TaxID=3418416 RepID=UPI003CFB1C44